MISIFNFFKLVVLLTITVKQTSMISFSKTNVVVLNIFFSQPLMNVRHFNFKRLLEINLFHETEPHNRRDGQFIRGKSERAMHCHTEFKMNHFTYSHHSLRDPQCYNMVSIGVFEPPVVKFQYCVAQKRNRSTFLSFSEMIRWKDASFSYSKRNLITIISKYSLVTMHI